MYSGFSVFRKDGKGTPIINPNRPGVLGAKEIPENENRVKQAQANNSNRATTMVIRRFHSCPPGQSTIELIDPTFATLLELCAQQQVMLNNASSDQEKVKYGVKMPITQTDGSISFVWIPIILYQTLCGLLISDGSIRSQKEASMQYMLELGSSKLALDLVVLVSAMLEICKLGYGMITYKQIWNPKDKKVYESYGCASITSPIFTRLYTIWYRPVDCGELFGHKPGSASIDKVLYPNNISLLDNLAICMAFLGDGYVQNNNQLLIATLAYSLRNLAAFIAYLNNLMNIKASIQADHPNTRKANKLPPRGKVYIGPEFSYKFSNRGEAPGNLSVHATIWLV